MDIVLHPAVQHMADKGYEGMTMDEAAIVHTMRRTLADAQSHAELIRIWLQQENPLGIRGPELSAWATEIAEWVLPTQMRRTKDERNKDNSQAAEQHKATQAASSEESDIPTSRR